METDKAKDERMERILARLRPKRRAFVMAYCTTSRLNAVSAARECGFGSPQAQGGKLYKQMREVIEWYLLRLRASSVMTPREIMEGLTGLAKNAEKDADKLKAYELLTRIHGMASDKLSVNVDVQVVKRELLSILGSVGYGTPAIVDGSVRVLPEPQLDTPLERLGDTQEADPTLPRVDTPGTTGDAS